MNDVVGFIIQFIWGRIIHLKNRLYVIDIDFYRKLVQHAVLIWFDLDINLHKSYYICKIYVS